MTLSQSTSLDGHLGPDDVAHAVRLAREILSLPADPVARLAHLAEQVGRVVSADGAALYEVRAEEGKAKQWVPRWRQRWNRGQEREFLELIDAADQIRCSHVAGRHCASRQLLASGSGAYFMYSCWAAGEGACTAMAFRREQDAFGERELVLAQSYHTACAPLGLIGEATGPATGRAAAAGHGDTGALRMAQVLTGLKRGQSEREIAEDLRLSPHTVHVYVKRIYREYGVGSRSELLSRWIELPVATGPGVRTEDRRNGRGSC